MYFGRGNLKEERNYGKQKRTRYLQKKKKARIKSHTKEIGTKNYASYKNEEKKRENIGKHLNTINDMEVKKIKILCVLNKIAQGNNKNWKEKEPR